MSYSIISLFSGAGGLDWGFHKHNYNIVASNEILESHLKTFTDYYKIPLININDYSNQINVGINGDVNDLEISQQVDVAIFGPPCQDFSVLRGKDKRAGVKVKRGQLYLQSLRILKTTQPKIFVFENVPGMVTANKGMAYETIQEDFINAGYTLIFNQIINMSHIGVPQSRKRLIIIGVKNDIIKKLDNVDEIISKYLENKLLEKYPLTPLEVFEGDILPNLNDKYYNIMKSFENSTDEIENDYAQKWIKEYNSLSLDIIQDYLKYNNIDELNDVEFKKAMKEHTKILKILDYYNNPLEKKVYSDESNSLPRRNLNIKNRMEHIPPFYNFKTVEGTQWQVKGLMSNIYRRLHPLIPSPTVIAYGGGGTGGYHYDFNRQGLTNRERSRLQTFPDDYLFNGKNSEMRAQIGEAVPPLGSYWISKVITEILDQI